MKRILAALALFGMLIQPAFSANYYSGVPVNRDALWTTTGAACPCEVKANPCGCQKAACPICNPAPACPVCKPAPACPTACPSKPTCSMCQPAPRCNMCETGAAAPITPRIIFYKELRSSSTCPMSMAPTSAKFLCPSCSTGAAAEIPKPKKEMKKKVVRGYW